MKMCTEVLYHDALISYQLYQLAVD